jgi:hypothetical protein
VALREVATSAPPRGRWRRLAVRRRANETPDADLVGWSYILFGCELEETPHKAAVRERAVQAWLSEHGIVTTST